MWGLVLFYSGFVSSDRVTIMEAANVITPQPSESILLRGCITNDNPLTVRLEYKHPIHGLQHIEAYRPWRVFGWTVRDNVTTTPSECNADKRPFLDDSKWDRPRERSL